jgi:hypothetical protein
MMAYITATLLLEYCYWNYDDRTTVIHAISEPTISAVSFGSDSTISSFLTGVPCSCLQHVKPFFRDFNVLTCCKHEQGTPVKNDEIVESLPNETAEMVGSEIACITVVRSS